MKDRLTEELVAMRVAKELKPGDYCNLGIGFPQHCASHIAEGVRVQTENGATGYGPLINIDDLDKVDADLVDAGAMFFTPAPGMCFFDMLTSFGMIRSGRLIGILGGLQVSEKGDLAAHSLSESDVYLQIGGSMDLAWGARKLIVAMTHSSKDGKPKIVKHLTMPLTAGECVDLIVTDIAVIAVTKAGLILKEVAPGWTPQEVQSFTEAPLTAAPDVKEMEL
jgi:3-oxoacid CoA-transferase B subunit